jgi:hypothetical protein
VHPQALEDPDGLRGNGHAVDSELGIQSQLLHNPALTSFMGPIVPCFHAEGTLIP